MTTKDFIRKRDFYLPYVSYLITDFPLSPLFDVYECYKGRSRYYLTFSQHVSFDADVVSCLVTRFNKYQFEFLQQKLKAFILSCSLSQRLALFNFYYVDSKVDFDSLNAFFSSALNSKFNFPVDDNLA